MKKFLSNFILPILILLVTNQYSSAQGCIPAGTQTVAGTVDVTVAASNSFTAVPTGNVIELVANGINVFTFDMCGNLADGWADGTSDTNITILDANGATATAVGYLDDGCTNGAGPQFFGPTAGEWTSPGAGTYYAYLAEWDWVDGYPGNAGDGDPCFSVDGTNSYDIEVSVTEGVPVLCADAAAGIIDGSLCANWGDTIRLSNTGYVIPNTDADTLHGYSWIVTSSPLTNTTQPNQDAAYLGAFTLATSYDPILFVNDNTSGLNAGATYYIYGVVFGNLHFDGVDGAANFDVACTYVSNELAIELKVDGADPCPAVGLEDLTEVKSWNLSPNPTSGLINFALELDKNRDVSVQILDIAGKSIMTKSFGSVEDINYTFDLSTLPNGVYFSRVAVDGNFTSEKIVLNR